MSRRTHITDAATATLADRGMRGLTHRAVDRTAGLPEGSTSYYFRTRLALLEAVVDRLAESTTADFQDMPLDLDELARVTAAQILAWLGDGRQRQVARFEISLEATRRPELRAAVGAARARVREPIAAAFAAHGVPNAAVRAKDFVACLDGLLLDRIIGGRTPESDLTELTELVRRQIVTATS